MMNQRCDLMMCGFDTNWYDDDHDDDHDDGDFGDYDNDDIYNTYYI